MCGQFTNVASWSSGLSVYLGWCIQKFTDWPPGARTANGTALCHWEQLYR